MTMFAVCVQSAVSSLLCALFSQPLCAEETVLNIANWEGYFGETTLADFTAETGIKVNYSAFDAAELLETKLLAGGSQLDVVFPTTDMLGRLAPIGVFQALDRGRLENWGKLDRPFLKALESVDPGNRFAVPYMRGTSGIAYNQTLVAERMADAPVDSWDMVFDPDILANFADCGVFFMDAPGEVISAAMVFLGKDPNSDNPDDLAAAKDVLAAVRPYIRHFNNSQIINELARGEICVALTYSGDAATATWKAQDSGYEADLAYRVPKEGAEIWFDVMAIPAEAPHVENAHLFIDFLMRPEVIAEITNTVFYANAISASLPYISEEIRCDPLIYPVRTDEDALFTLAPHGQDFLRARQRAWTAFKYGE